MFGGDANLMPYLIMMRIFHQGFQLLITIQNIIFINRSLKNVLNKMVLLYCNSLARLIILIRIS